MKIASITIYCNEDFRLDNWKRLYEEYKDELFLHIIINNGKKEDTSKLKEYFPDSIIIYSFSNNMTFSYNLGAKEALRHSEVDAIMQITNDIRFEKGTITKLYKKLISDGKLAVIGPVMLRKNSEIIESFGYNVNHYYSDASPLYMNMPYHNLNKEFEYVSYVPGGAIMIKRKSYELFGFQDEILHMYCDERDMSFRFKALGFKEGVLCKARAWHQHVFKPGTNKRNTTATYLTMRNRIYICSKYGNVFITTFVSLKKIAYFLAKYLIHLFIFPEKRIYDIAAIKGVLAGYFKNMNN